jgi:DNA invertase Pin-like site-specific DNA recombinase
MPATTSKYKRAPKCSDVVKNMRLIGFTRTISTLEIMAQMLLHKHETYKYKNWIDNRNINVAIQNHPKQIIRTTEQTLKT